MLKPIYLASVVLAVTVLSPALPLSAMPATRVDPATQSETNQLRLEIRLRQRRLYVYQGKTRTHSYPIAVGKPGWETPIGQFSVQQMIRNPTWIHPLTGTTIAAKHPENPLGRYWIGFWTDGKNWVGFHGTPNPQSVGKAASHGCIRMHNHHISELFQKVNLGTIVVVQP